MPKFLMDIESYKTRFFGGQRQYLFFVLFQGLGGTSKSGSSTLYNIASDIGAAYGLGAARDFWPYLVKSTSLPQTEIEEKVISLQHFNYKIPGNRIYNDWNVTFNLDEKGQLLGSLHDWQGYAHYHMSDYQSSYGINRDFRFDQKVFLVNYQGSSICSYDIYGAWPKSIGQVQLDYSQNELATVDVTFSYLYHEFNPGTSTAITDLVKQGVNALLGAKT